MKNAAVNNVAKALRELADKISNSLGGEYTTLSLEITSSEGHSSVKVAGYTPIVGHVTRDTFDAVAEALKAHPAKLLQAADRLRAEAAELEAKARRSL